MTSFIQGLQVACRTHYAGNLRRNFAEDHQGFLAIQHRPNRIGNVSSEILNIGAAIAPFSDGDVRYFANQSDNFSFAASVEVDVELGFFSAGALKHKQRQVSVRDLPSSDNAPGKCGSVFTRLKRRVDRVGIAFVGDEHVPRFPNVLVESFLGFEDRRDGLPAIGVIQIHRQQRSLLAKLLHLRFGLNGEHRISPSVVCPARREAGASYRVKRCFEVR